MRLPSVFDRRGLFRFFSEYGACIVGRAAMAGLDYTRAYQESFRRGWELRLEPDDDPDLSTHEYWCSQERHELAQAKQGARFAWPYTRHSHEIWYVTLRDEKGGVLASLGGVIDPSDADLMLLEAELADEVLAREREIDRVWAN